MLGVHAENIDQYDCLGATVVTWFHPRVFELFGTGRRHHPRNTTRPSPAAWLPYSTSGSTRARLHAQLLSAGTWRGSRPPSQITLETRRTSLSGSPVRSEFSYIFSPEKRATCLPIYECSADHLIGHSHLCKVFALTETRWKSPSRSIRLQPNRKSCHRGLVGIRGITHRASTRSTTARQRFESADRIRHRAAATGAARTLERNLRPAFMGQYVNFREPARTHRARRGRHAPTGSSSTRAVRASLARRRVRRFSRSVAEREIFDCRRGFAVLALNEPK